MSPEAPLKALVGLLPVLAFLAVLLYLESYKLKNLDTHLAPLMKGQNSMVIK